MGICVMDGQWAPPKLRGSGQCREVGLAFHVPGWVVAATPEETTVGDSAMADFIDETACAQVGVDYEDSAVR